MGMFGYLTAFQEMMMNQVKHNSFFTHVLTDQKCIL